MGTWSCRSYLRYGISSRNHQGLWCTGQARMEAAEKRCDCQLGCRGGRVLSPLSTQHILIPALVWSCWLHRVGRRLQRLDFKQSRRLFERRYVHAHSPRQPLVLIRFGRCFGCRLTLGRKRITFTLEPHQASSFGNPPPNRCG